MIGNHPGGSPEFQQFAQSVLGLLEPLLRQAACASTAEDRMPCKGEQVWCPVCAFSAFASGEQHPLASMIAEHGVALVALIRAMVSSYCPGPPGEGTEADDAEQSSQPTSRYQPIPVTIYE